MGKIPTTVVGTLVGRRVRRSPRRRGQKQNIGKDVHVNYGGSLHAVEFIMIMYVFRTTERGGHNDSRNIFVGKK